MISKSIASKSLDINQVYEILSMCIVDGMTRTELKSRTGLSNARVGQHLERLTVNQLIRREANGYYHVTTLGHDLYKRLTRPMGTIKRIEQMLENGVPTKEPVAPVKPHEAALSEEPEMLKVAQVSKRLNVHPHSIRRWCDEGILKGYRFGVRGDRRFNSRDVEEFKESRKIKLRIAT